MKRCWFGGALLVLILGAGLIASLSLGRFQRELARDLAQAAQITGADRDRAQILAEEAKEKWDSRRTLTAVLSDHEPMEEIEEHFSLLNPEAEAEDFRETCLRLSARLKALGEAQLPTWENLF